MQRTISVVVRDANGALKVVSDRQTIEDDDGFSGLHAIADAQKSFGALMVLALLDDDSIASIWTAPANAQPSVDAQAAAAQASLVETAAKAPDLLDETIAALISKGVLSEKDFSPDAVAVLTARKDARAVLSDALAVPVEAVAAAAEIIRGN